MRIKRFKHTAVFLSVAVLTTAAALLVSGCSSDECLGNKNSLPLAGFYRSATDDNGLPLQKPQAITVDSLQIAGLGAPGDSILASGTSPIGESYLPFRIDSDTTVYVFRYIAKEFAAYNLADTIRFVYSREPRFVSEACGVSYQFDIKEIYTTHVFIDSVVCPMMSIDNANIENLRIYFRADNTDEP